MAIGLISNTILKPYCSSSSDDNDDDYESAIPNNDVLVPLTIFDKAAFDLHVAVLYAFNPPMPSNEVLKEALSKVLVHYPHLAGRFTTDNQGRTCIILNNAGVRVTETYLPTTLAKQLPFHPSRDVSHLLPPVEGIEELCQIQLNRYACGGLVIGLTSHHRVADGQSMSSFFVAWAKFVRGLKIDPLPYHDRFAISVPRNTPKVEFDHNSIEFKKSTISPDTTPVFSSSIETLIIHYSTEFTNKLKAKVVEENNCNPHQRFSTFECLLSHAWKKVTQARGLDLEECTQVRVAVNGRARIKPAVPMEYFGNLVLWAYPKLKVKEVLNESHAYIAKAIHDEVARVDDKR
ncbi:Transferase [Macleaya cordata]|uniref:Transferase n=1 Tax=Macleaya cordata TaxID=56857 RepID=A0A200QM02_MACCD|nr:Transferase [Macleaya cordata]